MVSISPPIFQHNAFRTSLRSFLLIHFLGFFLLPMFPAPTASTSITPPQTAQTTTTAAAATAAVVGRPPQHHRTSSMPLIGNVLPEISATDGANAAPGAGPAAVGTTGAVTKSTAASRSLFGNKNNRKSLPAAAPRPSSCVLEAGIECLTFTSIMGENSDDNVGGPGDIFFFIFLFIIRSFLSFFLFLVSSANRHWTPLPPPSPAGPYQRRRRPRPHH